MISCKFSIALLGAGLLTSASVLAINLPKGTTMSTSPPTPRRSQWTRQLRTLAHALFMEAIVFPTGVALAAGQHY
jgi:hypothetical protein